MQQLIDFFRMGEYAPYIWAAYAAALGLMGWMITSSLRMLKAAERQLADAEKDR